MKKDPIINDTLNQILTKVMGGIDYVSRIALETQKSIPVVFRQLDILVDFGILKKQRAGKKVTYQVNWVNLSDIISSTIMLDIGKIRELTNAKHNEEKLAKEMNILIDTLPQELFGRKDALAGLVIAFFSEKKVKSLFEKFMAGIEEAGKDFSAYQDLSFEKCIEMFMDTFSMMDDKKKKEVLGIEIMENNKVLLEYLRLRYLQKKLVDPQRAMMDE